ncbi:MAG TPA: PIN domain nuclease [Thermoanaerobaculia bacterium]|nr:PIN domain nuclease [Thermoanaerobaculia bacterium]
MPILVDSSVWIDYFNGAVTPEADHLDRLLGRTSLVITDLILGEVLQGFREDRDFGRAREALLRLPVLPMAGVELALESAHSYRALRRKGITVRSTIDCWIATFCLREGLELLHADRDFEPFARHLGLKVVTPG